MDHFGQWQGHLQGEYDAMYYRPRSWPPTAFYLHLLNEDDAVVIINMRRFFSSTQFRSRAIYSGYAVIPFMVTLILPPGT
eukprot:8656614-Pyramimonas_sp.AAC.1